MERSSEDKITDLPALKILTITNPETHTIPSFVNRNIMPCLIIPSDVFFAYFSPDGTKVFSKYNGIVKEYDANTGQLLQSNYSLNSRTNVSLDENKEWEILPQQTQSKLYEVLQSIPNHFSFSPDHEKILTCSVSNVYVFNSKTGNLLQKLWPHTGHVHCVSFSPNGKMILTASEDGDAKVWDAETRKYGVNYHINKLLYKLEGHIGPVFSASFSQNGKMIVTASGDSTAKVWDAISGQLLQTLHGHSAGVLSAFFSSDGKMIVTISSDETVKIWSSITWQLLQTLRGDGRILEVSIGSNGTRILTTPNDGKTISVFICDSLIWLTMKAMLKGYIDSLSGDIEVWGEINPSYYGFKTHSNIDTVIMNAVLNKNDLGLYVRALLPGSQQ
jgi:WD40 repeat protein